jgi:beta-glucosidase/6-phospho-beta-glucosidase/beta-galactosidase
MTMFRTFFLAGFEGSTGYNRHGEWIDQIAATGHDDHLDADYARLRSVGIQAARESVRWPLVDRRGRYDFGSLLPMLRAARAHDVELLLDLFHFGYPNDADPFDEGFASRFANYCWAVARVVTAETPGPPAFAPVNEPSFFAWAGGEVGLFAPHRRERGRELKVNLVRAALLGIEAVRSACPGAAVVNVDALCRVVAPVGRPDLAAAVAHFNDAAVFESWDMLAGRLHPELGGSPSHLGVLGLNYYWTNQWELGASVPLDEGDPRRCGFRALVDTVWERYGAPLVVTETGHVGHRRAAWTAEIADAVFTARDAGIPVGGLCLYPILGMPEWHERGTWTRMGLWDVVTDEPGLVRVPHVASMAAVREAQRRFEERSPLLTPCGMAMPVEYRSPFLAR